MRLRGVLYNCLSAARPARLEQIIQETNADALLVTGLRWRTTLSRSYETLYFGRFLAVIFGYGPKASYSNRSAGVAVVLGPRLRGYIQTILSPSWSLQGRCGAVRVKSAGFDLLFAVGYVNPVTESGRKRLMQIKSARLTCEWVASTCRAAPSRCTPLAGGDWNTGFGINSDDFRWCSGIGPNNLGKVSEAGVALQEWVETGEICVLNTFYPEGGPTYFGTKSSSTIDAWLGPSDMVGSVLVCRVPWVLARRLQLIPASDFRDHVPLVLEWNYIFRFDFVMGAALASQRICWDFERLAACLQYGDGRLPFLQDLEKQFQQVAPELAGKKEENTAEGHWKSWMSSLLAVGSKHFLKKTGGAAATN